MRCCSPMRSTRRTLRRRSPMSRRACMASRLRRHLPAAAAVVGSLISGLRSEAENAEVMNVYTKIDLPLAPVLYRMEQAGIRIDTGALARLSKRFAVELDRVGRAHLLSWRGDGSISTRQNSLARCCSKIWACRHRSFGERERSYRPRRMSSNNWPRRTKLAAAIVHWSFATWRS